jgi:hypothetical protein
MTEWRKETSRNYSWGANAADVECDGSIVEVNVEHPIDWPSIIIMANNTYLAGVSRETRET